MDLNEQVDEKKLKRMIWRIYMEERENAKTGEKTDADMKKEIQNIIEDEVKKCY